MVHCTLHSLRSFLHTIGACSRVNLTRTSIVINLRTHKACCRLRFHTTMDLSRRSIVLSKHLHSLSTPDNETTTTITETTSTSSGGRSRTLTQHLRSQTVLCSTDLERLRQREQAGQEQIRKLQEGNRHLHVMKGILEAEKAYTTCLKTLVNSFVVSA